MGISYKKLQKSGFDDKTLEIVKSKINECFSLVIPNFDENLIKIELQGLNPLLNSTSSLHYIVTLLVKNANRPDEPPIGKFEFNYVKKTKRNLIDTFLFSLHEHFIKNYECLVCEGFIKEHTNSIQFIFFENFKFKHHVITFRLYNDLSYPKKMSVYLKDDNTFTIFWVKNVEITNSHLHETIDKIATFPDNDLINQRVFLTLLNVNAPDVFRQIFPEYSDDYTLEIDREPIDDLEIKANLASMLLI